MIRALFLSTYMVSGLNIVFCCNNEQVIKKTIDFLVDKNHAIFLVNHSDELFDILNKKTIHLVIIELDFRDKDAITLTSDIRIKKINHQPYIIIFSDKNEDYIQIAAFNSGADDFIIQPIKPILLEAKLATIKKRLPIENNCNEIQISNVNFFVDREQYLIITKHGKISLPRKEFEMINMMYKNSNKIFTRQDFANIIWNSPQVANSRTIDIHISNIRKILGSDIIKTDKGIGYMFNKDAL